MSLLTYINRLQYYNGQNDKTLRNKSNEIEQTLYVNQKKKTFSHIKSQWVLRRNI